MEECFFIHPDNIDKSRAELNLKVAVIARPDSFMQKNSCYHLIVETLRGVHTRCYLAHYKNIAFLIVYGRFDRIRSTSIDIDFALTQETLSFLGIEQIIGTFVAGSIKKSQKAGDIYIPDDFVGFGGYNQSRNKRKGFRNVDMFNPFCDELKECLCKTSQGLNFQVYTNGTYICFHGYPRIETEAELNFYEQMQWDIVGQTLDPEATLAREAGCHYAAIVSTVDDHALRLRFLANDQTARLQIDKNISEGRKKTFDLFLRALPKLVNLSITKCNCKEQRKHVNTRSENFYYRPDYLCE